MLRLLFISTRVRFLIVLWVCSVLVLSNWHVSASEPNQRKPKGNILTSFSVTEGDPLMVPLRLDGRHMSLSWTLAAARLSLTLPSVPI